MGSGGAAEAGVVGVRGAAVKAVPKASAKAAHFLADHERTWGFSVGLFVYVVVICVFLMRRSGRNIERYGEFSALEKPQ